MTTPSNFDLKNPWKVDPRVLDKLKGSFFYSLANMKRYKQCREFRKFIKSCYDTTSKTFTFGPKRDVELYFGLQDVYALSGIPVDGKPVICDDEDIQTLCNENLGTFEENAPNIMQLSKKWLKHTFEEVPNDATAEKLLCHVRAYLLYLIGCIILPKNDRNFCYPAYWLLFLKNLNPRELNGVAWGAAAHCSLTSAFCGRETVNVSGPMWLYELFFLERIPKIRDAFLGLSSSSGSKQNVPLHEYWCPLMASPGKKKNENLSLKQVLQDIRENMTDKDIVLKPYDVYMPRQRIFFSRVVLINFDRLQYHEPQKGARQLSINNLSELDNQEPLVEKSAKGSTNRKYCTRYRKYIKMWEARHLETMCIKDTCCSFKLPPLPDQLGDSEDEMADTEDDADINTTSSPKFSEDEPITNEISCPFNNTSVGLNSSQESGQVQQGPTMSELKATIAEEVVRAINLSMPTIFERVKEINQKVTEDKDVTEKDKEQVKENTTRTNKVLVEKEDFSDCMPGFNGLCDPIAALRWIHEMENIFKAIKCDDEEKVVYAITKLGLEALSWWDMVKDTCVPTAWHQFKEMFKDKFCPMSMVMQLEEELLTFVQGSQTVQEYAARFVEMAKYAEYQVATERRKMERFTRGLRTDIREIVSTKNLTTFLEAVGAAKDVEKEISKHSREMITYSLKRNREGSESSRTCTKCSKIHVGDCGFGSMGRHKLAHLA